MTNNELSFAVFCIESLGEKLNQPANKIYDMLTKDTDVLYQYIVPCYKPLHTQGKEYIMGDICNVLSERGITV